MYRVLSDLFSIFFLLVPVFAQTLTVPDPAGTTNSVVEVISIDQDTGEAITSIISTIIPTAVTTTTTPVVPDPGQQGPVAAPPDTATLTGPPQIVYTYTTQDAVGGRQVITTTFSPTYATPLPTTPLKSGTIWGFGDYTAQYGSVATQGAVNSAIDSRPGSLIWSAICGAVVFGAGGMLLV